MVPSDTLFRPEAVEAHRSRYGQPFRAATLPDYLITTLVGTLVLCSFTFLMSAKFARRETVFGTLEPVSGAPRLVSPRAGVISELYVHEGETVGRGQRIAAISTDSRTGSGQSLQGLLLSAVASEVGAASRERRARERDVRQRAADIKARESNLVDQVANNVERQAQQQQIIASMQKTVGAYAQLAEKKLVGDVLLRQQEQALLSAQIGLSQLKGEAKELAATAQALQSEMLRLESETELAAAAYQGADGQAREKIAAITGQSEAVVTSEQAGRVTAIKISVGSAVAIGSPIAVVVPSTAPLEVNLWSPSRASGFIRAGDRVRLMYDAFPYEKFGIALGTVVSVDKAPTNSEEVPLNIQRNEALYKVRVRPDTQVVKAFGKAWPLTMGMRLTADIVLERRSLLEWIFEPVAAQRRRSAA